MEQTKVLQELGVPRPKAIMYSKEQAARRIHDLTNRKGDGRNSRANPAKRQLVRNKLLVTKLWHRITSLAQKNPKKCWVAVAYFGNGASDQLPLENGSTLVVNASAEALGAGATNPDELEKLIKRGVEVYNHPNLHAKVFVFPKCAIVGSANVSRRSARQLVEAALEADDRGSIASCKKFVKSLCQGPPIGPEYLKSLKELYRPPAYADSSAASGAAARPAQDIELWFVRVEPIEFDDYDSAAESQGLPLAEERLTSSGFFVDNFCTSVAVFVRRMAAGGNERQISVAQIVGEEGELLAHPPYRVLHVERYKKDDGTAWVMVFVEASDAKDPIKLDTIIWHLRKCPTHMSLKSIATAKRITDRVLAGQFANLWVQA